LTHRSKKHLNFLFKNQPVASRSLAGDSTASFPSNFVARCPFCGYSVSNSGFETRAGCRFS